jgi:cysteine-rich repeat protein
MNKWLGLLGAILIVASFLACGQNGNSNGNSFLLDGGSDGGSDGDADSDADTDNDTDTDTDSDGDADSNVDTDTDTDADTDSDTDICIDKDNDTWCEEFDCDDENEAINPDADEVPGNGLDDDCDGITDEMADGGLPPSECGNTITEDGEVCDDGNQISGDGCNSTCTLNDNWDFVANTFVDGDQREPSLGCGLHRAVLAFTDWGGKDLSGASIMIRLFGEDGVPLNNSLGNTSEFVANTETAGHQSHPRVAMIGDTSFVVVWTDESNSGVSGSDIRGRVFAADGSAAAPDFLISSDQDGDQLNPAVAVANDGRFLVVWVDNSTAGLDNLGYAIRGRLFDATGVPLVNDQTATVGAFQINQVYANDQMQPDVAWMDSKFIVVWADKSGTLDNDSLGIVGGLVSDQGALLSGTDFLVNTTTASLQAAPRVTAQPGLGAIVVWTDNSLTDDLMYHGIRGRLLDLTGAGRVNSVSADTGDFQINTVVRAGQQFPMVSALAADGVFAVAWQDWSAEDGSGAGVRARLFSGSAAPRASVLSATGEDFPVNSTFWNPQLTPAICIGKGWSFAAWEDQSQEKPDDQGSAIRYRLLSGF